MDYVHPAMTDLAIQNIFDFFIAVIKKIAIKVARNVNTFEKCLWSFYVNNTSVIYLIYYISHNVYLEKNVVTFVFSMFLLSIKL